MIRRRRKTGLRDRAENVAAQEDLSGAKDPGWLRRGSLVRTRRDQGALARSMKWGVPTLRLSLSSIWTNAQAFVILIVGIAVVVFGGFSLYVAVKKIGIENYPDFRQDYSAAQALQAGVSIYGANTANAHTPFDVLPVLSLARLPFKKAYFAWDGLAVVCFGVMIAITLLELHISLPFPKLVLLVGVALCWWPFQAHLWTGQWSVLMGACLLGSWALLRHGREIPAGVLVGIACLVKLVPGVIILYLTFRRRWSAVVAASVTIVLGAIMTLKIVGLRDCMKFFVTIGPSNLLAYGAFPGNASLTGFFRRLLTDGPWVRPLVAAPGLAWFLVVLISLALLCTLARYSLARPATAERDDTTFALALVAMLLMSPLTWSHSFVILILPFALIVRDRLHGVGRRPYSFLHVALVFGLFSLPDLEIARTLSAHYSREGPPWYAALVLAAPTGGMFLLWSMLAARLSAPGIERGAPS